VIEYFCGEANYLFKQCGNNRAVILTGIELTAMFGLQSTTDGCEGPCPGDRLTTCGRVELSLAFRSMRMRSGSVRSVKKKWLRIYKGIFHTWPLYVVEWKCNISLGGREGDCVSECYEQ